MATTMTSLTTAWAAARSAASSTPAIAITAATRTSFTRTATLWTTHSRLDRTHHAVHTVKIRLVIGIEIRAAFDHRGRCALRRLVSHRRWSSLATLVSIWWRRRASHLCTLFFQNCLSRQLDPVAFNGEHFD